MPVDQSGRWLPERMDLDSYGEVVRIGVQKALLEGHYCASTAATHSPLSHSQHDIIPSPNGSSHKYSLSPSPNSSTHKYNFPRSIHAARISPSSSQHASTAALCPIEEEENVTPAAPPIKRQISQVSRFSMSRSPSTDSNTAEGLASGAGISIAAGNRSSFTRERTVGPPLSHSRLLLDCGMEIRSYSLSSASECSTAELLSRCVTILSAPLPYDPSKDLVKSDLKVTPAVVAAIDRAWASPHSVGESASINVIERGWTQFCLSHLLYLLILLTAHTAHTS